MISILVPVLLAALAITIVSGVVFAIMMLYSRHWHKWGKWGEDKVIVPSYITPAGIHGVPHWQWIRKCTTCGKIATRTGGFYIEEP